MCKVMGMSFSSYEFSPYEQFSWKKLPWKIRGNLYKDFSNFRHGREHFMLLLLWHGTDIN
jgi:hypothetical protein